ARLAAEIHLRSERYAKRPKRKFVSASTQEYAWAGYLRAWVDRVERVGNLNYPDEARRRRLAGTLVISVAIRRDGSVERADVIQSSGTRLLDDAALRIARLAEPYPPLPKTEGNIDGQDVTRTSNFLPGGELIDERCALTAPSTPGPRRCARTRRPRVRTAPRRAPARNTGRRRCC